jgi:hypothetical protein
VLDEIGPFDEGFHPAYYEDVDLCARARSAGYQVVYTPRATAIHRESTSVVREGVDYHRWMGRGRLRHVLKRYSATQFHCDFVPAERQWGASLTSHEMREGLRVAYLDTLLSLRELPRTGVLATASSEDGVARALAGLRDSLPDSPRRAIESSSSPEPETSERVVRQEGSSGPERPASEGFRAWLVNARRGLLRKWYVRSLLAGKELALAWEQIGAQAKELASLTEELTSLRVVVDLVERELTLTDQGIEALDRETTEGHRLVAHAIYSAREKLGRLEARVAELEGVCEGAGGPGIEP